MITGYSNRLSGRPNDTIKFMISTAFEFFDLSFVRLHCGDPFLKESIVSAPIGGKFQGINQILKPGSYGVVPDCSIQLVSDDFTLAVWIYPTLHKNEKQSILSNRDAIGNGFEIGLTNMGKIYFSIGSDSVVCDTNVSTHNWYHLTVRVKSGDLELRVKSHQRDFGGFDVKATSKSSAPYTPSNGQLYFAASNGGQNFFNGKISDPCLFSIRLEEHKCCLLAQDLYGNGVLQGAIAAWDFGQEISTQIVRDISGHGHHGSLVQLPVRSVTGPHWFGEVDNPTESPRTYAAIHFHEDSLSDAGWKSDFTLTIPKDWKSGVYAAKLISNDQVDYLPFAVIPAIATTKAKVACLLPTFTYVAYSSEMIDLKGLNCVYDTYVDGSGVPFSSIMQPLMNFRPNKGPLLSAAGETFSRHFNADLSLLDWFLSLDLECDIITDHDLHRDGIALLSAYKVIVSGSHPEYASSRILDAIEEFLKTGGNFMYLGGNGFYWVTDLSGDETTIEVRRPNGTRPWTAEPGESRHQFSGEIGGLWRARGRAPQRLVGVGFTAQGWMADDRCGLAQHYTQSSARNDHRYSNLFKGIKPDELIGSFPSLGLGCGAAGDEIDRADLKLGTPAQAVILGSATEFSVEYRQAIEEQCSINSASIQKNDVLIRSDIVWFDTGYGGAVFSTGSINWISCLTYDNCKNTVSTLTYNALFRMLNDSL